MDELTEKLVRIFTILATIGTLATYLLIAREYCNAILWRMILSIWIALGLLPISLCVWCILFEWILC
jgi:hypothetical protein